MNSMGKSLSSGSSYGHSFEESGWTMYFEDFFADENPDHDHQQQGSFSDIGHETSSLVSDAASLMVKKPPVEDVKNEQVVGLSINNKSCNRLSFKKRRTKGTLVDDALEDTASSPVSSPKVYNIVNQFNKNMKQDMSKEKARSGSRQEEDDDERRDFGCNERESDCSELKKRGLCLVPLSMVANYLG